jgi:hypothetical protein
MDGRAGYRAERDIDLRSGEPGCCSGSDTGETPSHSGRITLARGDGHVPRLSSPRPHALSAPWRHSAEPGVSFRRRSGRPLASFAEAIIGAATVYVRAREARVPRMRAAAATTGARALIVLAARPGV